jgi:parvulin-like peptidyl-prolyl isomerase
MTPFLRNRRNRRAYLLVVVSAGFALLVTACGGSSGSKLPKGVAATVAGQPITVAQVDDLIAQSKRSAIAQGQEKQFPKVGTDQYKALVQQSVGFIIQRVELEQQAKKQGITVTDAQVETEFKNLVKQYFGGSTSKYAKARDQRGLTDKAVKDDVRLQLLQTALGNKITAGIKVTEEEAHNYYLQHAPDYAKPQSRKVQHILVSTKAAADKLYKQLKAGADFSALAKKYSQDSGTKASGGKYTASKGVDDPAFDKVAFALKTGEISKPVKSQFGWHIIKALGPVQPRRVIPFEQEKASITSQILQARKQAAVTRWTDRVRLYYSTRLKYANGYAPPSTSTTSTTSIIPTAPTPTG